MIWTTVSIWLIAIGCLLGIAGLFALSDGVLAFFIITFAFGLYVFPIVGAIAGYQAANGKASFAISLLIAFVLGLVVFIFSNEDSHTVDVDSLVVFAPFLAVLLSFGLTHFMLYAKGINGLLHGVSILSISVTCFVCLYLLGAFQSRMAYFGLPEEMFFVRPQNDVANVHASPEKGVLLTQTDEPFNGKIISYKRRLNLNFWSKKESGIAYYKDGLRFGTSGDIILPECLNGMYRTYAGTMDWHINAPENQNKKHTFLLHRDYQKIIEAELSTDEVVYYQEIADQQSSMFDPFPLPSIRVVFANDTMIVREYVSFHSNGVVKSIERYFLCSQTIENDESGWEGENFSFDQLGFLNVYESKREWNENDFVETQFDSYQAIKKNAKLPTNHIQNVPKMRYVPKPQNWIHDNMVDNLIAVHGFPITTIFTAIPVNGEWKWLENDEARDLCELIHRSILTINYQDNETATYDFQKDATTIYIQSEQQDKTIKLYFTCDKILVNDGPYYFDIRAEKPNENREDRAFRKKIYDSVLAMIEKYVAQEKDDVFYPN